MTAVENSLRRLQTDDIDVYQIHRPDPDTDIEETLSALTDLVRSGKTRAFGTSNMPASNLVEAHWVAERRGLQRFRTEQPPYSMDGPTRDDLAVVAESGPRPIPPPRELSSSRLPACGASTPDNNTCRVLLGGATVSI